MIGFVLLFFWRVSHLSVDNVFVYSSWFLYCCSGSACCCGCGSSCCSSLSVEVSVSMIVEVDIAGRIITDCRCAGDRC